MTDTLLDQFMSCAGSGVTYRGKHISAGRESRISHRMSRLPRHKLGIRNLIPDEKGFVEFSRFLYVMNTEGTRGKP